MPARISENVQQKAAELAQHIAEELNLSGVLAIELFLTDSEELYVNELAPRPHNSGHYSIEACSFSQFDAHIRGISNWGIGLPQLLQPVVMVNLLGEHLEKSYQLCTSKPTGKSITMEKLNQKWAEKWATSPLQHLAYQKR